MKSKRAKASAASSPARVDAPPLAPGRKWLFRLIALVALPLLFFGGLELGLRLAGWGYDTSFFKPLRIGDHDFLVENDKFGLRFFPPELARSPAPVKMDATKAPGVCRIFILGESAALGDPRPAYGAGRYLEVLLRERFPHTRFEVVCVAVTAINSHAILPIARECAAHQGDIWVLYMGNNEMVGPFGATKVFGSAAPSATLVRLNLALQRIRVGQLLAALGRKLRGSNAERSPWAGMEMFVRSQVPPGDPVKERVYHNFQRNLDDILLAARQSGVEVILNSMAVNLKDSPPFASAHRAGFGPPGLAIWNHAYSNACQAQVEANFNNALQLFDQALPLDGNFAELQFRVGQCELALSNQPAGFTLTSPAGSAPAEIAAAPLASFERARDLDALPFRADSRINELLRARAARLDPARNRFFDAGLYFATNSPGGCPGREWFYEHVHFNFDGNYRLALAWACQVRQLLRPEQRRDATPDWASQEICERRLGLTDWNRASVLEDVLRRLGQPPLSTQTDNAARVADYRAQLDKLRERMRAPGALAAARDLYRDALRLAPGDFYLHENYAEFLETVGALKDATAQWQQVRALIPHHHLGWFESGRLLAIAGQRDEAAVLLSRAVALRPDLSEGWLELGKIHAAQEKTALALEEYERARRLLPQDYRVYYYIGKALSRLDRRVEALANFEHALKLHPDYPEALYALGEELAFSGRVVEAQRCFQEVLRLQPRYAMAHLNLGVALAKQGRVADAIQQFQETLRLEPQNPLAQDYLRKLQSSATPTQ